MSTTHIEKKDATTQFIEDAIAGGWKPKDFEGAISVWNYEDGLLKVPGTFRKTQSIKEYTLIEQILLDPLAWQAVGKTRGWGDTGHSFYGEWEMEEWLYWQHHFIDHLADGKTIDQALEALS